MNRKANRSILSLIIAFVIIASGNTTPAIRVDLSAKPDFFAVRGSNDSSCYGLQGNEIFFFQHDSALRELHFEFYVDGHQVLPIDYAEFKKVRGTGGPTVDMSTVVPTHLYIFLDYNGVPNFEYKKHQSVFIDSLSLKYASCW